MMFLLKRSTELNLQIWIYLLCITFAECKLQDSPVRGSLFDLKAETVVFENDALQANITWQSADLHDIKLDVGLIPIPNENCSNKKPCVTYDLLPNTTNILLPHDPMIELEHHECTIQLGCPYDIYVETTDKTLRQTIKYTAPDCVSNMCSCNHAHNLPQVLLNATVDENSFKIHWKVRTVPSDESLYNFFINSISISVGVQNNPLLRWGGQHLHLEEIQIPMQNANDTVDEEGYHIVNLNKIGSNSTEYRLLVRAYAIDDMRCPGKESNFTYRVQSNKITLAGFGHNYYVLISFSVVTLILIIGFAFSYRRMQNLISTKSIMKSWNGIYQNVPSVGFRSIKFQENFLYGEEMEHCEIPHSSLKLGHNIGKGAFGSVYLAVASRIGPKENSGLVAVKKLKKDHNVEEMDEFLNEIAIMRSISRHPNIVALIGYCTVEQPMLMVMEYVGCGDLLKYLRKLRDQHELRTRADMRLSIQMKPPNRMVDSSTSSTMNLLSRCSNASKSTKSYTNLSKIGCSEQMPPINLSDHVTVTTLNNLELEVNYLELCHSSYSETSYVSGTETTTSTKQASDIENYAMYPSPQISFECILDNKELHRFAVQIARGMKHLEERGIIHRDLAARNILIDENKQLKISDFGLSRSIIYMTRRAKKLPIRWMAIEALRENVYTSKSDVWSFGIVLWEIGTLGGIPYANVSNELLLKYLAEGHRMQRPEVCSEQLYQLLMQCWLESPLERPFFSEIVQLLESSERNEHVYVNFDEIAPNYVFPPTTITAKLENA